MGSDNSRGKDKWAESNKVYTRRFPNRGAKKPGNNVAVVVEEGNDCNRSKNGSVVERDQPCLPTLELETAENGNSLPPQKCVSLSSRFDVVSDDDWSQHGAAAPPNGCEPSNGNKSDVVKVEDGSRINQSEGASDDSSHAAAPAPLPNGRQPSCGDYVGVVKANDKARIDNLEGRLKKSDIKKKRRELIAELGQLRSLMKKLQAWEAQLNSNLENGDCTHSQVSAMEVAEKGGAGSRMNPVVGFMENGHEVAGFVEIDKRTAKVNQYCRNSEFLLGRDRSLPKSNKRLKANKHGEDVDFRFRMDRHKIQAFKNCGTLLAKLMRHKHGWVFNTPVDVKGLGLHDYYTIIKHPMDLGTVKGRLNKKGYKSPKEFAEDVRLTFRNAMAYNPKGHDVHIMAEMLSKIFEEKWTVIETKYNLDGCNGIGHNASVLAPTAIQTLPSLPPPQPPLGTRSFEFNRSKSMGRPIDSNSNAVSYASVGRTPGLNEPKAKDPPIRDMTYEEKQRLSTNLQTLPFDKLDDIVQIIRKRNTALSQHDDEIEVEIDSVDAETLWELDRFVTDHEQSLRRKKAEMAFRARQEAGQTIHETNPSPAPAMVDSPKEAKRVSPPRMEIQGHDASQSSSSSSSSSDSQSSSSDSDSDSSSACEPDGSHSPKT